MMRNKNSNWWQDNSYATWAEAQRTARRRHRNEVIAIVGIYLGVVVISTLMFIFLSGGLS